MEMQSAMSKDIEDPMVSRNDMLIENANTQPVELDSAQYEEIDTDTGEVKPKSETPAEDAPGY